MSGGLQSERGPVSKSLFAKVQQGWKGIVPTQGTPIACRLLSRRVPRTGRDDWVCGGLSRCTAGFGSSGPPKWWERQLGLLGLHINSCYQRSGLEAVGWDAGAGAGDGTYGAGPRQCRGMPDGPTVSG